MVTSPNNDIENLVRQIDHEQVMSRQLMARIRELEEMVQDRDERIYNLTHPNKRKRGNR